MKKDNGLFVISLDFELNWGVRDLQNINSYAENISNVWKVIPNLLNYFDKYEVKATFATVGFLLARNQKELLNYIPEKLPNYENIDLSPYDDVINKDIDDKRHFCFDLIEMIKNSQHELASHTFSHYYGLEPGQTANDFQIDTQSFVDIGKDKGIKIESIVFPRNQVNKQYLGILKENGILSYRGTEKSWFYKASNGNNNTLLKRFFRLLDSYVNISGHNTYNLDFVNKEFPFNIPSSRFLRPYSPNLKSLERLRIKRIKDSMTYTAKNNEIFHLWWHPHNFGKNMSENFFVLEEILKHYRSLKSIYNFQSTTMSKISNALRNEG